MADKMPAALFVKELKAALERKDGYIMGSKGQDPSKWATGSWWFTQYDNQPKQKEKALYWRSHAKRVWDCNGMAEGIYEDFSGVNINTRARYNYAQWCDVKGSGTIPVKYRTKGAAVFWGDSGASDIYHVAYLVEPVKMDHPEGDWYLIEARGVMYGVVGCTNGETLYSRKPNYWGLMTKYFDYETDYVNTAAVIATSRTLKNGCEGDDVKRLQTNLIRLGYDCGKWGADGDFGDATEIALKAFQTAHGLEIDGIYGDKSKAEMEKALAALDSPVESPRFVVIEGGSCYVRTAPNTNGTKVGVAHENDRFTYAGQTSENGWLLIDYENRNAWVSGKYASLMK